MNAIGRSTFCDYTYKLPVLQLSCKMFDRLVVHKVLCKKSLKIPKCNHNSYIEEQTTQWPKEKVQKDKQRSTKHTYKTKDRVTRTPLKTGGELRCSGRVSSSCSTSGNCFHRLIVPCLYVTDW